MPDYKIISGGQTGVDRAALDAAMSLNIPCGGWCPKGRRAEDGVIPRHYPLDETKTDQYPERTRKNVQDSDGTLILTEGPPDRGTLLTLELAKKSGKPHFVLDLSQNSLLTDAAMNWFVESKIRILNVAGPRESSKTGIYERAKIFLEKLFQDLQL